VNLSRSLDDDEFDLSLKALIWEVGRQLLEAQEERIAQGGRAVFEVSGLDIEVSFIATESSRGGGGFDLKVIRADAQRQVDQQAIHKIVLHLVAASDDDLGHFDAVTPIRPRRPRVDDPSE